MTAEEKLKIRQMRIKGKSYTEISKILKISENTIKTFCRRNDLQNRPPSKERFAYCQNCEETLQIIEKLWALKLNPKLMIYIGFKWVLSNKNRDKLKKKSVYLIK